MKKIIPVFTLALLGLIFQASAVQNIDGMFGYKLGQTFDNKGQEKAIQDVSLGYIYQLQLPDEKKIDYLDHYYVYTTPQTKKINGFLAIKDYKTNEQCVSAQNTFLAALKETYGTSGSENGPTFIQDKDNSNIGIKIECVDDRLIFNNLDLALTETAIKENAALDNQPVKSLK